MYNKISNIVQRFHTALLALKIWIDHDTLHRFISPTTARLLEIDRLKF